MEFDSIEASSILINSRANRIKGVSSDIVQTMISFVKLL